jgi:uncharacterized protein (UPF0371 family)
VKKGFNNKKYLKLQTEKILNKVEEFNNKLYIEFGGKLFGDSHAARVLPGFNPDAKIEVLKKLSKKLEVLFVISAKDIEKNKMRSDLDIAYEMDVLRQIDKLTAMGILADKVVITLFEGEPAALVFKNKIERRNLKVYIHTYTKGYPADVETIVSDTGYGANSYIETEKPIVVVTAPGANSGKLATCLSQIYHEYKRGVKAGYSKYETFPVWNLPLRHPVNVAYEAATANIGDINMIDSFHLEKYGVMTINYNRDLEVFPVLKTILNRIAGRDIYFSPTDMSVNMAGFAINDDEMLAHAAKDEIIRRYYYAQCEYKKGIDNEASINRLEMLMSELGINTGFRRVAAAATEKFKQKKEIAIALELGNGRIITGRNTDIMTAGASVLINSLKILAKINDDIYLLMPAQLEPMQKLKSYLYKNEETLLNAYDVLTALSIGKATNPIAARVLANLDKLHGCDAHSSHMIRREDKDAFKYLDISLSQEPEFFSRNLYED